MGLQVYIVLSSHLAWVWEGFLKYTAPEERGGETHTREGKAVVLRAGVEILNFLP